MAPLRLWWTRFLDFLFPRETDKWLGSLRIGLGAASNRLCAVLKEVIGTTCSPVPGGDL